MKYSDYHMYHIYNRGAHQMPIFGGDEDYMLCLALLAKYAIIYEIAVLAYCLMPNHYHLVVRQKEGGSVSRYIQTTFNAFTQTLNCRNAHSGTMFQGRAKGRHIDSDSYLVRVVRYLHMNPVRAGLVEQPGNWTFSDYAAWIGQAPPFFPNNELVLQYFATKGDYRKYVQKFYEGDDKSKIEQFL